MPSQTHPKYRKDIDGLRAVAVLSVILFHAFPNLMKGGFVGVDIFFVISGYLITTIIISSLEAQKFSFLEFYSKRVRRIFPALFIMLIAALAFGWYVLLSDEYSQLGLHAAGGSGFIANLILWSESGYFDNAANTKPLLHLWSLGIEEQFYIFWPLLLWFVWKKKKHSSFLWITILVSLLSFGLNLYWIYDYRTAAFYSPFSRFWELMIGGYLAYLTIHRSDILSPLKNAQSIFGFTLLAVALVFITEEKAFPGWWALLPTISAFFIISAGPAAWLNRVLLSNRLMVWIGLISYPLYLWHWPFLVLGKITKGENLQPYERFIMIAVAFIFSWLTYQFIEKRVRAARKELSIRWLVAMTVIGFAGITVLTGIVKPRHQSLGLSKILSAKLDWEFPGDYLHRIPDPYLKYYVEESGLHKTVFIGDSNLEQYTSRIDQVLKQHHGNANTAIVFGNPYHGDMLRYIFEQKDRQKETLYMLRQVIDDPKVTNIVFAARWPKYTKELYEKEEYDNFKNFITSFKGKKVYIILTMPTGKELSPDNMYEGSRLGRLKAKEYRDVFFSLKAFHSMVDTSHLKLKELGAEIGGIIIDPMDTLCVDGVVPVFDHDGKPLYKDGGHMTATYARRAATYIDQTLY